MVGSVKFVVLKIDLIKAQHGDPQSELSGRLRQEDGKFKLATVTQ